MGSATISPKAKSDLCTTGLSAAIGRYFSFLAERQNDGRIGFRTIFGGIALLTVIAVLRMYWTWATWGNLSIDSGHETYVPAVLAQGKMLYRDLWYHYGPIAPYVNSYLFRIFGVHLNVLYFAGSSAALGSAIFLFLSGIELGFCLAGWIAGAVVAIEAFEPGLFSFPLPYSFPAVYGCLVTCILLWVLLRSLRSPNLIWILVAWSLAAIGLLLKLEYGVACYGAVSLAIVLRAFDMKGLRRTLTDCAAIVPSALGCFLVIRWMVSIGGVEFITQENIASWPTSYFMRTYGGTWLTLTGFALTWRALAEALLQTVFVVGVLFVVRECCYGSKPSLMRILIRVSVVICLVGYHRAVLEKNSVFELFEAAFFPRAMVLYLAVGTAWLTWYLWTRGWKKESAGLFLALAFAAVLAFRLLFSVVASGYSIYYNGPVVLGYLILASTFVERGQKERAAGGIAGRFVCYACLATVMLWASLLSVYQPKLALLRTEYGSPRVPESVARNYGAGIAFLKQKYAQGDAVLILPEDTTMYFLSGTHAPTRVYIFTPGVVSPGRMTNEILQEIQNKRVKYLLWSNRTFLEYGVPVFGKDFNQELAAYLRGHYENIGPLVPRDNTNDELVLTVWERKEEGALK